MNFRILSSICIIAILSSACTKSYNFELSDPLEHGGTLYQGYFIGADSSAISMRMGIVQDDPKALSLEGYLVSGDQVIRKNIYKKQDSIIMQSGLHSVLKGVYINDTTIQGELQYGIGKKDRKTPFVLYETQGERFPKQDSLTPIDFNGTWTLDFHNPIGEFTLDYDMRYMKQIDISRQGHIVIAKGTIASEGIQGLDGVVTQDGFMLASFHHSQPYLIQATFIDENHFEATLISVSDIYEFTGTRKNSLAVDSEFSEGVFRGFYMYVKAFLDYSLL